MWEPNNEFIKVLNTAKIPFSIIEKSNADIVFDVLLNKFASKKKRDSRLFEVLADCSAISYFQSHEFLFDFPSKGEVYVFFDFRYKEVLFKLSSFSDVINAWNKCSNFSFYVVDTNFEYLLSLTEEGSIIGCGTASDWIEHLHASGSLT